LPPFDFRQYFIDGISGAREVIERGIEPQQQIENAFIHMTDECRSDLFPFHGERGALERRDFADSDLPACRIEGGLDVIQRDLISRIVDR
jgi:hypothetical protein